MAKRDRRSEIMGAAERLFTSRRYHEIAVDDIAQAAGVGKGTIYRYFKNKEDLFFQTASSGYEALCEVIRAGEAGDGPFETQLLKACRRISAFYQRRRQLFRMMQSEQLRMHWRRGEVRERWRERQHRLVAAISMIVEKGMTEQRVRDDLPAEVLARYLLGMLRTRAWSSSEVPEGCQSLEVTVDLFLKGALSREAAVYGTKT